LRRWIDNPVVYAAIPSSGQRPPRRIPSSFEWWLTHEEVMGSRRQCRTWHFRRMRPYLPHPSRDQRAL